MKGTYVAGINLVQPLYAGGKIRAGNKLGTIGRECAEENARLERMQTIADADNAYWTYVAVRRKVAMLDSYMQLMDTLLAQTERSVSAEMVTNDDLLRIKAKRSEILYQRQKAFNGLELCRLSLCNAIVSISEVGLHPLIRYWKYGCRRRLTAASTIVRS